MTRPDKLDLQRFGISALPPVAPRFNIAPSRDVLVILEREGKREADFARWGLVPAWAKDPAIGTKLVNARADTAYEKPAFQSIMKSRRCLIPADVFYEWRIVPGTKRKQPHAIRVAGGEPFALGGVWDAWKQPDGDLLITCAILTTDANVAMSAIHDRMPVIIPPEKYRAWLDPHLADPAVLDLTRPIPSDQIESWPLSPLVNVPANDEPSVLARAPEEIAPQLDVFGI